MEKGGHELLWSRWGLAYATSSFLLSEASFDFELFFQWSSLLISTVFCFLFKPSYVHTYISVRVFTSVECVMIIWPHGCGSLFKAAGHHASFGFFLQASTLSWQKFMKKHCVDSSIKPNNTIQERKRFFPPNSESLDHLREPYFWLKDTKSIWHPYFWKTSFPSFPSFLPKATSSMEMRSPLGWASLAPSWRDPLVAWCWASSGTSSVERPEPRRARGNQAETCSSRGLSVSFSFFIWL